MNAKRALLGTLGALAIAAGLPAQGAELRVVGSDLLGPAFAETVRDFARRSDRTLTLSLEGSRSAVTQLQQGKADVGVVMVRAGRPVPQDGFRSFPMAHLVVTVLIPAASPLKQITLPELAGIYGAAAGGGFAHWGDLGLAGDWAVRAVEPQALRPGCGLSLEIFRNLVLAGSDLKSVVALQPSVGALQQKLAASDTGIALTDAWRVENKKLKVLPVARTPNDVAYAPTPEHVQAGNYPLRLPVWLVVRREAVADDLGFLQFLLGDEVAQALESATVMPLPRQARDELRFALEQP